MLTWVKRSSKAVAAPASARCQPHRRACKTGGSRGAWRPSRRCTWSAGGQRSGRAPYSRSPWWGPSHRQLSWSSAAPWCLKMRHFLSKAEAHVMIFNAHWSSTDTYPGTCPHMLPVLQGWAGSTGDAAPSRGDPGLWLQFWKSPARWCKRWFQSSANLSWEKKQITLIKYIYVWRPLCFNSRTWGSQRNPLLQTLRCSIHLRLLQPCPALTPHWRCARGPFWWGAGRSWSWRSLHSCWPWVCAGNPPLSSTQRDPWAMSSLRYSQAPKVLWEKKKTKKHMFWLRYQKCDECLILWCQVVSPLSPTSFLAHSMAFWMLSSLVTFSRTVFKLGPATLFRSSAPFSVRQPANTCKPLRSRFLHRRFPNPESQPVTNTNLSEMSSTSRLSLYSQTRIHRTTMVPQMYRPAFSLRERIPKRRFLPIQMQ